MNTEFKATSTPYFQARSKPMHVWKSASHPPCQVASI